MKHAHGCFDWDSGYFILSTESDLVRIKEDEALWQEARSLIYELSGETRTYRGVEKETDTAKRAKRIMDRAKNKVNKNDGS